MPEELSQQLNSQLLITRYLNNKNRNITHSRYVDMIKTSYNTILLCINTGGLKLSDNEKIHIII